MTDPSARFPEPDEQPQQVRIPTREEVRQLVHVQSEELREVALRDGDVYQRVLDHQDLRNQFAMALEQAHGPAAAEAFLHLCAEETKTRSQHLEAHAAALSAKSEQVLAEQAAGEFRTSPVRAVLGALVVLGVAAWMIGLFN